jgi:hypothetical protein
MKRRMLILSAPLMLASVGARFGFAAEKMRELSKKDLNSLLAKMSTTQDHLRLAAHYHAVAKRYEEESAEHTAMAKMYRDKPTTSETKHPMAPDTAAHCDYLAESLGKASKEANLMAIAHEAMAK